MHRTITHSSLTHSGYSTLPI